MIYQGQSSPPKLQTQYIKNISKVPKRKYAIHYILTTYQFVLCPHHYFFKGFMPSLLNHLKYYVAIQNYEPKPPYDPKIFIRL